MTFFSRLVPKVTGPSNTEQATFGAASALKDMASAMNGWHVELGPSFRIKSISEPAHNRPEAPFLSELPLGFTLWEAVGHGSIPKGRWAELADCLEAHSFFGDFAYTLRHDVRGARHYVLSGIPHQGTDGTFSGYHCLVLDNTDRIQEKQTLKTTDAYLSSVFEYCPNIMAIRTIEGRFLKINPEAQRVLGLTAAEAIGQDPALLLQPSEVNQIIHGDEAVLETEQVVRLEEHYRVDNDDRSFLTVKFPVFDPDHCLVGVGSVGTDITERKRAEAQLHTTSNYDRLTNLPNRMLAVDRLDQAIGSARRTEKAVTLISLEVESFKAVATDFGQAQADEFVQKVAISLSECIRESDTLARVGADDFWVLLSNLDTSIEVSDILAKVLEPFATKFEVEGKDITTDLSIGYAVYPTDATQPQDLIRHADAALREAKAADVKMPVRYTEDLSAASKWRQEMVGQLQGALDRNEFFLVYQPIVCPIEDKICAVEALIRWENPRLGLVGPDKFIPVAESTGLIEQIGAWVLDQACRDAVAFNAQIQEPVAISVNVSPRQLTGSKFVGRVSGVLEEHGLAPELLKLEITESSIVSGSNDSTTQLEDLRAQGVSLSLDDFGTGYSALSYLQRLPFDTIKLDRSFIMELKTFDDHEVALIETVIQMGKRLGMTIIAEGIETEDQINYLRDQQCDLLQGYYYSKPIILSDLLALLSAPPAFHSNLAETADA